MQKEKEANNKNKGKKGNRYRKGEEDRKEFKDSFDSGGASSRGGPARYAF